jgi:hypothetical protein
MLLISMMIVMIVMIAVTNKQLRKKTKLHNPKTSFSMLCSEPNVT